MPYIEAARRADIDPFISQLKEVVLHLNEGEMNYLLTSLVWHHITHGGTVPLRYADIQEGIGLLECVKLELYRAVAGPYEDAKREAHGDVYPR